MTAIWSDGAIRLRIGLVPVSLYCTVEASDQISKVYRLNRKIPETAMVSGILFFAFLYVWTFLFLRYFDPSRDPHCPAGSQAKDSGGLPGPIPFSLGARLK